MSSYCDSWLHRFLNLKIQEGDAHNIFCPAFDCFQLVPVEVIESVVSREMDRRYLQFDIKVGRGGRPGTLGEGRPPQPHPDWGERGGWWGCLSTWLTLKQFFLV